LEEVVSYFNDLGVFLAYCFPLIFEFLEDHLRTDELLVRVELILEQSVGYLPGLVLLLTLLVALNIPRIQGSLHSLRF